MEATEPLSGFSSADHLHVVLCLQVVTIAEAVPCLFGYCGLRLYFFKSTLSVRSKSCVEGPLVSRVDWHDCEGWGVSSQIL